MSFEWPLALLALLLVPLLLAAYVVHERRRAAVAARLTTPALLSNLIDRAPGRLRHVPLAVLLVALVAMVLGVARPHATVSVPREDATIVLAVDVSLSMTATDVKPSRLAAARAAAKAFLRKVPGKFRVGVVAFASRAIAALPPTTDRTLAARALESLRSGDGTALGDAVALAAELGRRQHAPDGTVPPTAVLLISDGARMGGATSPQAAARRARALHVPVYTVLVGTEAGVVEVPLTGGFRQIIHVPPRADTLEQLARTTHGDFFTARDDERLREVYEQLGQRLGHKKESREISDFFAGGSAALLLVGGALSGLWFRRVP